jgi:hypothetical protein
MNKSLHTVCLLLFTSLIMAQAVTPVQTILLSKRTADWCPNCGTWGWNFSKSVLDKTKDQDIVFWNVHHSGGLLNATTDAIAKNLGGSYQPIFFVNTDVEDLGVSSGATSQTNAINNLLAYLDLNKAAGAFVGMGSEAIIDGSNNVKVKAKVKFYEAASSVEDFFIGAYIVKKNFVHPQASVGNTAVHHSVLSESLTPNAIFGTKIVKGPVAANKEFTAEFSYPNLKLHNGKMSDTKIVVVMWKYDSATKRYVYNNSREVSLSTVSATKDEFNDDAFNFNPVLDNGRINLTFNQDITNPVVSMVDLAGKSVNLNVSLTSNKTAEVEVNAAPAGIYILKVQANNTYKAKQIYYSN